MSSLLPKSIREKHNALYSFCLWDKSWVHDPCLCNEKPKRKPTEAEELRQLNFQNRAVDEARTILNLCDDLEKELRELREELESIVELNDTHDPSL